MAIRKTLGQQATATLATLARPGAEGRIKKKEG